MRCEQPGFIRIGQWDNAMRRSVWARILPPQEDLVGDPPTEEDMAKWLAWKPEVVEVCAGREGDDAFIRVTPDDPCFAALLDVVSYAIGNLEDDRPSVDERDALKSRIEGMEQALTQACNILDEHPDPSARIAAMSLRGFIRGGR